MKKSELSILLGLLISLVVSFFMDVNTQAQTIRSETLRLHIIADDNSDSAQQLKLKVRDSVTSVCRELFSDADDVAKAIEITNSNLDYIQRTANHTLTENGADYTAVCSVENFWFDTTLYEGFTMPRGEYTALTIRLGEAEGKNWWCVAYPSMCTGGSTKYEDDSSNTFIETDTFRLKFKVVELWEEAKAVFDSSIKKYSNL